MVSIRTELAEHGMFPKKKLGQHFLVDRNIMSKVVEAARIDKGDVILEVGPGLGEMTAILAGLAEKVIAVEVDSKLAQILEKKMDGYPNVEVIRQDILKIEFNKFRGAGHHKLKVVANLPYRISTPLLFRFIEARDLFATLTLMLQREVAERLVAPPGGKAYGPLSIFVQIFSDVSIYFYVKPSAFFPPPKIESAVVRISWKEKPVVSVEDEEWFKKVVKGAMCYRRKTLINALKYSGLVSAGASELRFEGAGIDFQRRPGTLSLQEFIKLAEILKPPAGE